MRLQDALTADSGPYQRAYAVTGHDEASEARTRVLIVIHEAPRAPYGGECYITLGQDTRGDSVLAIIPGSEQAEPIERTHPGLDWRPGWPETPDKEAR